MSAATDYLNKWITVSQVHQLTITVCTAQPPSNLTDPAAFGPGIVSFGWGLRGSVVKDGAGNAVGLNFGSVKTAFSDRPADPADSYPDQQHFNKNDTDPVHYTLTIVGDFVHVAADLIRWGATWEADTEQTDGAGGQLYFPAIPGAGHGPSAAMFMSFQPTGSIGFL